MIEVSEEVWDCVAGWLGLTSLTKALCA